MLLNKSNHTLNDKKNFLVTGGAGFIGSHFVDMILKESHNVVVLDCLSYSSQPHFLPQDKMTLITGDICNDKVVENILNKYNIDYIVNFAAETHVDQSIENPKKFIDTNVCGTYILLKEAYEYYKKKNFPATFRFLQVSTDEVYGSLSEKGYFSEKSRIDPRSPYSASKASSDHLVNAWFHTFNMPIIITRCSNNFGPRQHQEKLIPRAIYSALNEISIPLYGNGKNIRDWMYVEDHCRGLYLALQNGKVGETYCFGGEQEKENLDLVLLICKILDELIPRKNGKSYKELVEFVTDRLGHDFRYAIDNSYAKKMLGFSVGKDFEDNLRKTVKWYVDIFQ